MMLDRGRPALNGQLLHCRKTQSFQYTVNTNAGKPLVGELAVIGIELQVPGDHPDKPLSAQYYCQGG
jgi:hypothetical protein